MLAAAAGPVAGHEVPTLSECHLADVLREPGPVLRNISVQDWSACDREWFGATGITALAAAPLLIEGRAAGVLGIYATSPLGETTIRAMGIVADNIALAVARDRTEQQKAELLRRTQESLVRIQGLAKVSLAVNVGLSVDDVLAVVTEKARELIGAHLSVTSLTVDRSWAQAINSVSVSNKYEHWKTYDEKPSGTGIYSLVCELNKPLRMTQAELEAHPRWRERGGAADRHPPPRGWLAAPLVDARGNNIGILQLSDKHDGDFNAEDEAVVVQLAQIASAAVQSARLHRETKEAWLVARRAAERTAHLQNATAALASAMTKEEVASITHRNVAPRFGATSAEVRLLSGDQVARQPIASLGHSEGGVAGDDTIATSEAVTEVQQTGRPIFSQAAQTGTAILPLVDGDRMLGTVVFRFSQPKAFEDGDREILLTIAGQVSQALRRVRAYETAVEADRHKDEFMAMLGHELRNPLTPISTALQLMRMRGDAAFRREHDIIERQVRHVVSLVDDLLDVSRITRGKVALRKQILDLATVISKAVEMATPLLEERGHSLEVSVEDGPLHVDADPARLAQVIANLLTNAAKYTERGGQIVLKVALERDDVVTTVRDNGMGIAADLLPRVFDLFVQADRTLDRAKGGLGIGLTVVKRLVEVHGGTVVARSEGPGRGSEFVVTLPGARSELAEAAAVPARPTLTVAGRTRAPRKVLIVDDNVDLAMTLAEALAEMGHHTRVANDAVAALEAAGVFQPDIALLDIGLPVMDGYELATKLRGDLKLARVGLIAVTGYGHQADRERAHAAGFDAHLVKPVDLEKVEQVIVSMSTEQAREQQRATAPDLYPK